ncbi:MAG TPA: sigma-70 family RNA polymerase sigma factor [Candidatus Acidoferrum sp.]|nr:sigma-70 family RNA polymerase sigma factor [Candidatus Acidoferrum sp.]
MHDNDIKQRTLITFLPPSADSDFLAALQKFVERDADRRLRIVRDWLAIRIDGIHRCVIGSESWCLIEFEGGTSKVEIVGRDAEGEVVIATYLPTYDGPKTEAWKVSLPWGDEVSCNFEYDDEECVRVEAKRMVKTKFFEKQLTRTLNFLSGHAQQARAPKLEFGGFDKSYVERLRNGDPATQHHFFAYFEKLLNMRLRARRLPSDRVEDLKQETFTRVITALRQGGEVREPERFSTFVNSICNNVLLEHYWAAAANSYAPEDAHVGLPDKVLDPDAALLGKQSAERVRQVLKAMPTRDRDLLRAVFFEEKDRDTVCREFGVDRDYLRVLLLRAKAKFKDNWSEPIWDDLLSKD